MILSLGGWSVRIRTSRIVTLFQILPFELTVLFIIANLFLRNVASFLKFYPHDWLGLVIYLTLMKNDWYENLSIVNAFICRNHWADHSRIHYLVYNFVKAAEIFASRFGFLSLTKLGIKLNICNQNTFFSDYRNFILLIKILPVTNFDDCHNYFKLNFFSRVMDNVLTI